MSFWNFFRIKPISSFAIIDIGSAQVSGALVSRSPNGHNRIIFSTKIDTGIDGDLNFDSFDFKTIQAVKAVTHNLLRNNLSKPEKFICFLSSAFLISQTKIINYSQDTSFVFTEKMFNVITRREAEDFRLRNETSDQFSVVENKIMQIKLDGYEIENPFGKKISKLSISQFLSGSPSKQLEKIEQAIISQSHSDRISFHSCSFAAFSVLRDRMMKKNFISIDVGGELTDISVCIDGILLESLSFPYGVNSIIRDTAISQNTFRSEARSQLNLYSGGRLQARAKDIFERSLVNARQKWTSSIADALSLILESSVIPDHIILTGDTNADQIFINWLKEGDFKKYMLSNVPFKVSYIDYSKFSDEVRKEKGVKDTYLVFESIFLEKLTSKV